MNSKPFVPLVDYLPKSNVAGQNKAVNDYTNSTFWDGLGNMFTGNLDQQRTLALQNREMAYNAYEAQKNREFNALEAEKNRAFNKEMAEKQYQIAVEDLKKAGLNPYLAYSNGGNNVASSSPASGNSASVGSRGSTPTGKGFGLLSSLAMSLISSAVGIGSSLIQANNAMQIADMKDSTLRYLTRFRRSR